MARTWPGVLTEMPLKQGGESFMQGELVINEYGRYCIHDDKLELSSGESIEVYTAFGWIPMRVEHDGNEYFLTSNLVSFYPKHVYARIA